VFPTTLSGQWEDELKDKSVEEGLAILNLTKAIGVSEEALLAPDVVLVTHGMLRAERRRSSERISWGEAWGCKGWLRAPPVDVKTDWTSLGRHDLIVLMPWGTEVLVDHVGGGRPAVWLAVVQRKGQGGLGGHGGAGNHRRPVFLGAHGLGARRHH